MKRFSFIPFAALFLGASLLLGACSDKSPQNSALPSSENSSAAVSVQTPETSAPQAQKEQTFVQYNTEALEGYEPTLRLLENGTFEFSAQLYDGAVVLKGSYEAVETGYVLRVQESSSPVITAESVGDIELEKTENGVLYRGVTVGLTSEGSVFNVKS